MSLEHDERPWGHYDVIEDAPDCKVKRIVVKPGCRNSYQRHQKRAECWVVVSGEGRFLVDGVWVLGKQGDAIVVPCGAKHRWHNTGVENLVLVEVQTGTYFGEDDEERFEDDFGRA